MASYGGYNPYPSTYGGDVRPVEKIHEALNDDVGRYLDTSDGTLVRSETYAEALMINAAWEGAQASHNAWIASKATYSLPTLEEAFGLRPKSSDSPTIRRRVLDAKMRSVGGNAEPDIRDVCERIMGGNFVTLGYVDAAEEVAYWPGIYPGPPGFEWATNREIVLVEVTKDGLSQEAFSERVAQLYEKLDDMLPAFMDFNIYVHNTNGTDEGFILDLSLLDEAAFA